ncbi:MAG: FHA domain-containing protein [Actinomycetota bacterium]
MENGEERQSDIPPGAAMILECTSDTGVTLEVKHGQVIGREADIDVSGLSDTQYMSRKHARFHHRRGRWHLENLSSKSFTYVNGKQVSPGDTIELKPGDRLTFGTTRCTYKE